MGDLGYLYTRREAEAPPTASQIVEGMSDDGSGACS
jgi:hypothetical protein